MSISLRRRRGAANLGQPLIAMLTVIVTVVARAAPTPSPTLSPLPISTVRAYAHAGARASGLDPQLVLAVIEAESAGDPHAVSRAGAVGLMQLAPQTAADCGIRTRFDARANVACGARTLALLVRRYGLARAIAAFNWGAGNVDRVGGHLSRFPRETQLYVHAVLAAYDLLQH